MEAAHRLLTPCRLLTSAECMIPGLAGHGSVLPRGDPPSWDLDSNCKSLRHLPCSLARGHRRRLALAEGIEACAASRSHTLVRLSLKGSKDPGCWPRSGPAASLQAGRGFLPGEQLARQGEDPLWRDHRRCERCQQCSKPAPVAMSPLTSQRAVSVRAGLGRSCGMSSGRSVTLQHMGSRAGQG